MSGIRYPEDFKIQAVEQVTRQSHSLSSVAGRLRVSYKSLSDWVKQWQQTP
ncbi:transposase [Lacimicrobium alkaliphilum]|uniref:transposase n=1 Tax=Lacimicrobium alkaliphilum TaxID=1526571 RepID=UPI0012E3BA77